MTETLPLNPDTDQWIICWERIDDNPARRQKGKGVGRFSKLDAQVIADELNERYPDIHHWPEIAP